eukprot:gene28535-31694_t
MVRVLDELRVVEKFYVPSDNKEISPELITEFMSAKEELGKLVSKALEEWRQDESVLISIGDSIVWFSASGISTKLEPPLLIMQEYMIWIKGENRGASTKVVLYERYTPLRVRVRVDPAQRRIDEEARWSAFGPLLNLEGVSPSPDAFDSLIIIRNHYQTLSDAFLQSGT